MVSLRPLAGRVAFGLSQGSDQSSVVLGLRFVTGQDQSPGCLALGLSRCQISPLLCLAFGLSVCRLSPLWCLAFGLSVCRISPLWCLALSRGQDQSPQPNLNVIMRRRKENIPKEIKYTEGNKAYVDHTSNARGRECLLVRWLCLCVCVGGGGGGGLFFR